MKKYLIIALTLLIGQTSFGQGSEFKAYSNGLIYSENTMSKLSHIVDSLNLKYKSCDLNKTYYSQCQAIGHIVRLEDGTIRAAVNDMEEEISLEDFKVKYPKAKIEENVLVVRFDYQDYDNQDVIEFSEVNLDGGYGFKLKMSNELHLYDDVLSSKWLFQYCQETEYSNESVAAFYFPTEFNSSPLSEKYAKMIGYADCLIDTTAENFNGEMKQGWVDLPENWTELSKAKQENRLQEMRQTIVMGLCSQDMRPREHAVNIAVLSAETTNWEVFLRAHLDIMNDRFERASDGSYAWASRKTYIKELEELDINVVDLIIGISLRIENSAENHYYGSIGRMGRALSETKNQELIEQTLLSMMEDSDLDDYNRVLAYYLFDNYAFYFKNKKRKSEKIERLKKAVDKMPTYLKEMIKFEKWIIGPISASPTPQAAIKSAILKTTKQNPT